MATQTVFWLMLFAIAATVIFPQIDKFGKEGTLVKGKVVRKSVRWSNHFDLNLQTIRHYYATIYVAGKHINVRLREGDFEQIETGSTINAMVITGWSGRIYGLNAKLFEH